MKDGRFEIILDETVSTRTILVVIYNLGKIVYYNISIVDLKSDLSEEFKEKLKEHQ